MFLLLISIKSFEIMNGQIVCFDEEINFDNLIDHIEQIFVSFSNIWIGAYIMLEPR